MAVLVVELAALGVGEHLVGLGELLEALLGRRVVRVGVRVQLAREAAEGLLDLGLARAALDAEHLVVVALRLLSHRVPDVFDEARQLAGGGADGADHHRRSPCASAR